MGFDFSDFANSYIDDLKRTLDNIPMSSLEAFWNLVELTKQEGGSVHFIGNGGSASEAQHIATEFMVRIKHERLALPAVALTADTTVLTATGND